MLRFWRPGHHRLFLGLAGMSSWWSQVDLLNRGVQIGNREGMRRHYSIRGDRTNDCLIALCCQWCALAQERREIELEENSFGELTQSK